MTTHCTVTRVFVRSIAVLLGMVLISPVPADTSSRVSAQDVEMTEQYSPADQDGRFTYIIEFVEPGLIAQHRQRSSSAFNYRSPATLAARDQLMAIQAQHLSRIGRTVGWDAQPSHFYLATRNGIALRLTPEEAERVALLPEVKAINRERIYPVNTFRGPDFIGADSIWDGSNVPGLTPFRGEGIIAAILDSGIPDPADGHPSFVNDPSCGHGVGDVPDKVISLVDCSTSDANSQCNGPDPVDENGHGSHVASTVAGNEVDNSANPSPGLPLPFTAISGVAPCASIRSYDVCNADGGRGCGGADIFAGLESVLFDNAAAIGPISIMNYSISGGANPWVDFDRIKLDLVEAGIFVAASAGNTSAGTPDPVGAVNHLGPWVMSVAASTHDFAGRQFRRLNLAGLPSDIEPVEGTGPPLTADFIGDLRWAGDVDPDNVLGCVPFPADAFLGEAALISRGTCAFAVKVDNAVAAGATLVIIANNAGAPFTMSGLETTTVSSFMVSDSDGADMVATLAGATAEVTVLATRFLEVQPRQPDVLASFSLRGPTRSPLQDLQKPNITGPGVGILAGVPGGYALLSGTSMSSPHVAGAALLVRQANPQWTASEVKSALQMTAFKGGTKQDGSTSWDWDDVGHGRVDLTKAALAGLVMDESFINYEAANPALGGDVKTLNLPDMRNMNCLLECSFERTLRNTLGVASSWTVTPNSFNPDLDIQVSPTTFSFTGEASETVTLTITVTPQANLTANVEFGEIVLTEDADLAPEAHLTVAISGTDSIPAAAAIDATELAIVLSEGASASTSFNISNVAVGTVVDDLTFVIDEAVPASVILDGAREASPPQPVDLVLDDGIATIVGVDGEQFLWLNQFTPGSLDLPFTLEQVAIGFAPGNAGVNVGDPFDVHVWVDPDRDPTNGATLVASVTGQTVSSGVNFQTIALPGGLAIDAADGDVLIGVVNRTTAALYRPAIGDPPGNSQQRSWIGAGFPGGVAADPPVITDAGFFGLVDSVLSGRNWTIRGFGTGGSACLTPSEVPWLSVTPSSGTIAGGSSQEIQVDVDSTELGAGLHEARLCISTSDVANPVFILPLSVEVLGDEVFQDRFEQ